MSEMGVTPAGRFASCPVYSDGVQIQPENAIFHLMELMNCFFKNNV